MMGTIGKVLVVAGLILVVVGAMLAVGEKTAFLGRLPGDVRFGGRGWPFYLPITTCAVLSLVLTLVINLVMQVLFRR
jgi:hypothetical protein